MKQLSTATTRARSLPILREGRIIVLLLACCLALSFGCAPSDNQTPPSAAGDAIDSTATSKPARPHLFLITADALRADHLSSAGYPRLTSPHLDQLAKNGWHFEDAVTVVPKTGPSFATIFSGRTPIEHGVTGNFQRLPNEIRLLAERLRSGGYRAAAFVSNPVLKPNRGYDRGFAPYKIFSGEDSMEGVVFAFERWADGHDWSQPTFVWLHFIDPHGPYTPRGEFADLFRDDALYADDGRVALRNPSSQGRRRHQILGAVPPYQRLGQESRVAEFVRRYDAEIRAMDAQVGAVLDSLDRRDLTQGSITAFLSDHGESLGEHDYFFEHGWFAYEPTLAIPLIVRLPGQTEGEVVRKTVSTLNLLPTFLHLADIPYGEDEELRPSLFEQNANGSWRASIRKTPVPIQNAGFFPVRLFGLRTADFKYLRNQDEANSEHRGEELFSLADDPDELNNLAFDPSLAETLEQLRAQHVESTRRLRARAAGLGRGEAEFVTDDERLRKELEALGYVGGN